MSNNKVSIGKKVSISEKNGNVESIRTGNKSDLKNLLSKVNDFTVELYNDSIGDKDFNRIQKLGFKAKSVAKSPATRMIYFTR